MPDRYKNRFAELKFANKKAFIPFNILGYPTPTACCRLIEMFIDSGAAALELGIAFSDPVADGPIIQRAAQETLSSGFTTKDAFNLIAELRAYDAGIPIGLLVYYNTVLKYGIEQFYARAQAVGVDGILIADLPLESANEVLPIARHYSIKPIFIASTLTAGDRLNLLLEYADGFIYAVSKLGITGSQQSYDNDLSDLVARIKAKSKLPVCIGFGISTPEQARRMCNLAADGVITGSKIIEMIGSLDSLSDFSLSDISIMKNYLRSMIEAAGKNWRLSKVSSA